jgi:hypothetical protein
MLAVEQEKEGGEEGDGADDAKANLHAPITVATGAFMVFKPW